MAGPVSRGRIVWYDLVTTDPAAAKDFYGKVTGWGTTPWEPPEGGKPYTMWAAGEDPVGGLIELPEEAAAQGAPPHWLAYVTVPDIDAVIRETEAGGGELLMPPETVDAVGTFAVLKDPQGAVFAPFTPADGAAGDVPPPQVGHFSWHDLATTDHEAAFQFYSGIFGWKKTEAVDMGEMGIYQMFGPESDVGFYLGGMFDKPADVPAPPHWLYYIMVPDIEKAVSAVREAGGQVLNGPMEVPGGDWIAQCMDPQGAAFALHAAKGDGEG